jgi:hypothetical protein
MEKLPVVSHCCLVGVVSSSNETVIVDRSGFEKLQKVRGILSAKILGWNFGFKGFLLYLQAMFICPS